MIHRKSISSLFDVLSNFKVEINELNKNSIRNKKFDYELMDDEEVKFVINSEIPSQQKRNLLLSQIGLARINIFSEVNARIRSFEKKEKFEDAINLMNDYITNVASSFI